MTEIKFYHNAPDRLNAACRITAKAVQQGRRVVVYAPREAVARRFDTQLWSFQPLVFIPHVPQHSRLAARTPVLIATTLDAIEVQDVLLNLDDSMPDAFSRFNMLVEVVGQADEERIPARGRWQQYKQQGYTVQAYDLAAMAGE